MTWIHLFAHATLPFPCFFVPPHHFLQLFPCPCKSLLSAIESWPPTGTRRWLGDHWSTSLLLASSPILTDPPPRGAISSSLVNTPSRTLEALLDNITWLNGLNWIFPCSVCFYGKHLVDVNVHKKNNNSWAAFSSTPKYNLNDTPRLKITGMFLFNTETRRPTFKHKEPFERQSART